MTKRTASFKSLPIAYHCIDMIAKTEAEQIALIQANEMEVSYDDLRHHTDIGASFLRKIGIEAGDQVIIPSINDFRFYLLFFALNKIGAIPCLIESDYTGSLDEVKAIISVNNILPNKTLKTNWDSTIKISIDNSTNESWHSYFDGIRKSRPFACQPIVSNTPLALIFSKKKSASIILSTPKQEIACYSFVSAQLSNVFDFVILHQRIAVQ